MLNATEFQNFMVFHILLIFKYRLIHFPDFNIDNKSIDFVILSQYFVNNTVFYPTALKGCRGIVFTHGVQMGGRAGSRKKFVWPVSRKP